MDDLICVLSDFINERPSIITFSDYSLADAHQVSGIVSYQCNDNNNALVQQISHFAKLQKIVSIIDDVLSGVEYIKVKGIAIKDIYPRKELRSMGDIDLLVHIEDVAVIKEKMLENGFVFVRSSDDEYVFQKHMQNIEIHTQLIHDGPGKDLLVSYFKNAWFYSENGTLKWNFHFLYILAHLRGHFVKGGVGFRQFMDLALIERNVKLDWPFIIEETRKIGLYDFMKIVLGFIERWFEVPSPIPINIDDDFFEFATDEVLKNGVFGRSNVNNKGNMVSRLAINTGISEREARGKYILNNVFPDLKIMRKLPYCGYLQKYPALLPVAWIHRFFYRVGNKESMKHLKEEVFVSKDKITNRVDYLKQWGL